MTTFKGTAGIDSFVGSSGRDTFSSISSGDSVDGKGGIDNISIDLSAMTTAVVYDAVAAASDAGTTVGGNINVRNVELLKALKTGSANDTLVVSVEQGGFTWNGGGGTDTLKYDFSLATQAVHSTVSGGSFIFHADQWAVDENTVTSKVDILNIIGSQFNDSFVGGSKDDIIRGGDGDDVLNPGSGGKDYIDGGAGFDRIALDYAASAENITYDATVAASLNGGKIFNGTIIKNVEGIASIATGSGSDKLIVDAGTHDFYWNAGQGFDQLVADYGDAGHGIVVSAVATGMGPEIVITGGDMADGTSGQIFGLDRMYMTGSDFGDSIQGTAGGDRLDGGKGVDTLAGGLGDDTYIVDSSHDVVQEAADGGFDIVYAKSNFSLVGAAVENLTLLGSKLISATGNELDNLILGNIADNRITGGAGNDTLYGDDGADTFVFGPGSGNDLIRDFYVSDNDRLDLSAYHAQAAAVLSQHGYDTWIDLGGGNVITVKYVQAHDAGFLSHIIW